MIKKVVLDKADRMYHFPFDIEDFFPKRTLKTGEKKIRTIDLGHFNWLIENRIETNNGAFEMVSSEDYLKLKEAIADWFSREYGIMVNPRKEVYIGQGIHRIIFDICLSFVEYGDIVLCPEPGMPFYRRLVISSGGVPVIYPIYTRSDYKPSLSRLDTKLGKAAKLLILNNPNNPMGTLQDETEIDELVHLASKKNVFIINDAAYCSLAEEKFRPIRSIPGGSKVSLEVFSIPFTFGLPYIPLGFAIGPMDIINSLHTIGKTICSAVPKSWISDCVKAIIDYPLNELKDVRKKINQSRLEAERMAESAGWETIGGGSCPFMWVRIPERKQSATYAAALLRRKKILILPGTAFGETGDGYLRFSLTAPPENYKEAAERLSKKFSFRPQTGRSKNVK